MSEGTLPRPEYPRPQFERVDWLNLNGEWAFAFDDADEGLGAGWWREGHRLATKITVPFPYGSRLSGIGDRGRHEVVWYARDFDLPSQYTGCQIWLHFGAVEETAQVWLNGEPVGENRGGRVPFSFEVTGQLRPGRNRLTLRAEARPEYVSSRGGARGWGEAAGGGGSRPVGIWQSVWLEPVAPTHLAHMRVTPEVEREAVRLQLEIAGGAREGLQLRVRALIEGREAGCAVVAVERARVGLTLPLRYMALWSPEHPFLYDLELTLLCHGMAVDRVKSYFGMRQLAVSGGQLLLNGQPFYACAVLDRGYFPDGPTAPSDTTLRRDVELAKAFGFNSVRKQGKIEEPRWLTWCDRLGLLVWAEMPPAPCGSVGAAEAFVEEWARVVERDYNHPCIVSWAPFGESRRPLLAAPSEQEEFLEGVLALTRALDGARPVVGCEGWEHLPVVEIERAADAAGTECAAGFCHPQLTDGEREANGLLTADRCPKEAPEKIAALNRELVHRFRERHDLPAPVPIPIELPPAPPPSLPAPRSQPDPSPAAAPPIPLGRSGIPVPVRLTTP